IERWRERWVDNLERYANLECVKLILPWSTPKMRFCTSELKTRIITQELVRRFPGQQIISITGVRAEEAQERANQPISEPMKELSRNPRKGAPTSGVAWRPIHHWLEEDVWEVHATYHLPVHEGYIVYDLSRIS